MRDLPNEILFEIYKLSDLPTKFLLNKVFKWKFNRVNPCFDLKIFEKKERARIKFLKMIPWRYEIEILANTLVDMENRLRRLERCINSLDDNLSRIQSPSNVRDL